MADVLTPEQRHRNMVAIKGKDTKPEMVVRRLVHSLGYRYRLHSKDLPGKPDLVLTRHKRIIEVYGCYWHMHNCAYGIVVPKTNTEFWQSKRRATVNRDQRNLERLEQMGWRVLVVWECQTKDIDALTESIKEFLDVTN